MKRRKGNSDCHYPNDKFREGWERMFERSKLAPEWFGEAGPLICVPGKRERLLYEEYDHSNGRVA